METLESSALDTLSGPVRSAQGLSLRDVPWRWSDVIIGLTPMLLGRIAPVILDLRWLAEAPRWIWIPLSIANMAWMLGFPLVMAHRRQAERPWFPQLPRPRVLLVEILCALIAIPTMLLAMSAVVSLVTSLTGRAMEPGLPLEPIARSPHQVDRLALMILAISVAPLAEETFFRGMLYNVLRIRFHRRLALPLQAVIFGFLHPFSIAQSSIVALIGLSLGIVYEWRKKLLTSILLHSLWNSMAVVVMMAAIAASANAPWLGIGGDPVEGGCVVRVIEPVGPAAKAGLRIGDVITSLDDQPATDIARIAKLVRQKHIGDSMTIEYLRNGKSHRAEAILEKRSEPMTEKNH